MGSWHFLNQVGTLHELSCIFKKKGFCQWGKNK